MNDLVLVALGAAPATIVSLITMSKIWWWDERVRIRVTAIGPTEDGKHALLATFTNMSAFPVTVGAPVVCEHGNKNYAYSMTSGPQGNLLPSIRQGNLGIRLAAREQCAIAVECTPEISKRGKITKVVVTTTCGFKKSAKVR